MVAPDSPTPLAGAVTARGWPSSNAPMSVAAPSGRGLPSGSVDPLAGSSTPASTVGEPASWWRSSPARLTSSGAAVWLCAEPGGLIEQKKQLAMPSKFEWSIRRLPKQAPPPPAPQPDTDAVVLTSAAPGPPARIELITVDVAFALQAPGSQFPVCTRAIEPGAGATAVTLRSVTLSSDTIALLFATVLGANAVLLRITAALSVGGFATPNIARSAVPVPPMASTSSTTNGLASVPPTKNSAL